MAYFVDRRQNPKDKSLGNRQRFVRRAKAQIKEVVDRSIKGRNISDVANGETVTIPTKGIDEPRFRHAPVGGRHDRVLPGNKEFRPGDKIPKPQGAAGKDGKQASDSGEGEDEFQFALSRDEFLDIFFEDLELPDLVKTSLKEVLTFKPKRAGIAVAGNPANLNVLRTMRQAYGRRLALKRPRNAEVDEVKAALFALERKTDKSADDRKRMSALQEQLALLQRRQRAVPFIDPVDLRYNAFQMQPEPNTKAVMFCLMDVSGSMGEREKDLAKRFFILLHLFLKRRYDHIDVVFVRHTHEAHEVDEETFFYSRETGGTVVSTALVEMLRIVRERYPVSEWNIYAAQASDGDNFSGDAGKCVSLLQQEIMPVCQYYAYVEILDEREAELFQAAAGGTALWKAYQTVSADWANFEMKRIARPGDIYPVFRELFASRPEQQHAIGAFRRPKA